MKKLPFKLVVLTLMAASCSSGSTDFDATGNFETDELIISAEASGKIMSLSVQEGESLKANQVVGFVDTIQLFLRKKQLQYSIQAVLAKQANTSVQLSSLLEQLATAAKEKKRIENLLKSDAATLKQLDDANAQILVLQRQMDALNSTLSINNASLRSEALPLKAQLDQIQDQIKKSAVVNPIGGTVLTQYALENEIVNPGKALYKIADLSTLTLRAYISGNQLGGISIGQPVKISVDATDGKYKTYDGVIAWVSDKAEFTPKTIQTKAERANLVYAMKIKVKNDGYLKIGMYGEVKF
ncbi:MAG TPA: HlyD family efflux transporter periplasmic adaptor subunit [Cyclobacteriaceae bacterium]|nr:HlyD family efflux transporter periplasmic adaptor subunit [Cyclobacteriaceae bacterium]